MRGFKLISFGEFSYMCKGKECAEFQVLCTIDKPEPVSGWLHECKPSECKIWRGLSRAENRELSKIAPNKQSTPCPGSDDMYADNTRNASGTYDFLHG